MNKDFKSKLDTHHYPANLDNWWKSAPYSFKFYPRDAQITSQGQEVFLPISPQNLSVTTNFASNVIATLYGTVEEHTEQRYYDIQITGTTGMVAQYRYDIPEKENRQTVSSREAFSIDRSTGVLGGFFSKTISAVMNVANMATSLIGRSNDSGVKDLNATGYATFHNLYKFFLEYKRDTAGVAESGQPADSTTKRKFYPLYFINYKDGLKYPCNLRSFALTRSATDPMLYNYSIVLRAISMMPIDAQDANLIGEVLPTTEQRLKNLGLDGIRGSTILGEVKQTANTVKGIIGTVVGGKNIIGR